jgi:hypothetical protein
MTGIVHCHSSVSSQFSMRVCALEKNRTKFLYEGFASIPDDLPQRATLFGIHNAEAE